MIPQPDDADLPDETSDLAEDLSYSLDSLARELDDGDDGQALAEMGLPPVSFDQVLGMLTPVVKAKATRNPEGAKRALALLYLESGALLEDHVDEDPETLL